MYLPINTPLIYVIDGDVNPSLFFLHLATLVKTVSVLTLISYEEDERLTRLLQKHSNLSPPRKDFGKYLQIWKKQYPTSRQYDVPAEKIVFEKISVFAQNLEQGELLCDHLFIYAGPEVLVSYHESFSGGAVHVSTSLPEEDVSLFAKQLGLERRKEANS